jgi:predicted TIM-barrel fold metal-dependent hydrolase
MSTLGVRTFVLTCALAMPPQGRRAHKPVIDVHLHAMRASIAGGLETYLADTKPLIERPVFDRLSAAKSDSALLNGTLAAMNRFNVVRGVISGELVDAYTNAAPDRFIRSLMVSRLNLPADSLRALFAGGRYGALGEISTQYSGISPDDARLEPYFAIAEELQIPVGIHMGMGGPGAPAYRARLGNPLLLEDVLARHPRLRLYVMHAGYPMMAEMIALMQSYPHVYADVADIDWARPRNSFHAYLRGLMDAGLGQRLMFGSDQVVWPEAIGIAIEAIESANYLTTRQKRDILCNNAATFFKLPASTCE